MTKTTCKNCNQVLVKNSQFCHCCGQSTREYDESFWSVVASYVHELLDIDGRMFRTLKVLISRPGELTKAFNEGHRVLYSPPLRLYLIISIVFFILVTYIGPLYSTVVPLSESIVDYYARAMFLLFPMFALIVQLFYRTSRYLGNLVFSLHIHTITYLVLMLVMPLEANESLHVAFIWLQLPPTLYLGWYYFTAFRHVYQESWPLIIVKSLAIIFLYGGLMGIAFDVVIARLFT